MLAVHVLPQGDGPQCMAVFSFLNSPICILQFADFGGRLAVGFQCGRVSHLFSCDDTVINLDWLIDGQCGLGFTFSVLYFRLQCLILVHYRFCFLRTVYLTQVPLSDLWLWNHFLILVGNFTNNNTNSIANSTKDPLLTLLLILQRVWCSLWPRMDILLFVIAPQALFLHLSQFIQRSPA